MKKEFGIFLISLGVILIGFGSYDGFEKYNKEMIRENKKSYYDGIYLAPGDTVVVTSESKENINAQINNELYEFTYNGKYYENSETGFYIVFTDDKLVLYKDGEEIRTLLKEKK